MGLSPRLRHESRHSILASEKKHWTEGQRFSRIAVFGETEASDELLTDPRCLEFFSGQNWMDR